MKLAALKTPILVGIVFIVALSGLSWLVMFTTKNKYTNADTHLYYADFDDASGLRWKTKVQMNGIEVGKIEDIVHVRDAQGLLVARIGLRILKRYQIFSNASMRKVSESLLGDFHIDIDPGTSDHELLKSGSVICRVKTSGDFASIQTELSQVAKDVGKITSSLARVLGSAEGELSMQTIVHNIDAASKSLALGVKSLSGIVVSNEHNVHATLANLNSISLALAKTTDNNGDIYKTLQQLPKIMEHLANVAEALDLMAVGSPKSTTEKQTVAIAKEQQEIRGMLGQLNSSVENLNQILTKINKGEGSLGKLINDPHVADSIEQTVDDAGSLLGGISRTKTRIELRSEYHQPFGLSNDVVQPSLKNTLGLWLVPKPDKYYILEAIADPRGKQTREIKSVVDKSVKPEKEISNIEKTVISYNTLKFSAQFAKRYYFATFRFGIIENTGGVGLNLYGLNDKLELRLDVYDFDRLDLQTKRSIFPRIRTMVMYQLLKHIHLQVGVDDPINHNWRTWFLGGVLRFTDADLKSMLFVAPKMQ